MKRIFRGKVDQKFHPTDPVGFQAHLRSLEGQEVEVTIQKYRKTRTGEQNRYYWGVVVKLIAEHCGYEPEEAHDAMRLKFLQSHGDGIMLTIRSTTSLDTKEMTEYIEQCRRLGAEMGVQIPSPGEVEF